MPSTRKQARRALGRQSHAPRRRWAGKARKAAKRSAAYLATGKLIWEAAWASSGLDKPKLMREPVPLSVPCRGKKDSMRALMAAARAYCEAKAGDSGFSEARVVRVDEDPASPIEVNTRDPPRAERQRMRRAHPLRLDGDPLDPATWDSRQGQCVFDYLLHRQKDAKTFKKLFKSRTTIALAMLGYWIYPEKGYGKFAVDPEALPPKVERQVTRLLENGVQTVPHMQNLATALKTACYALHQDDTVPFFAWVPPAATTRNTKSIAYRVVSGHMYPIEDQHAVDSISAISRGIRAGRELYVSHHFFQGKSAEDEEDGDATARGDDTDAAPAPILHPEPVDPATGQATSGADLMARIMTETGVQVFDYKTLAFDGTDVTAFSLEGQRHVVGAAAPTAKMLMEGMGHKYTGQGLNYALLQLMEKTVPDRVRSTPNPEFLDTLIGLKNRTHHGARLYNLGPPEVQEPEDDDRVTAYHLARARQEEVTAEEARRRLVGYLATGRARACDIAKCHSACLLEPLEEWMDFNVHAHWEPYTGPQPFNGQVRFVDGRCEELPADDRFPWAAPRVLPLGLYYVTTEDNDLLHGNHVYSSGMLTKAMRCGIVFWIEAQALATGRQDVGLYRPLLAEIVRHCDADPRVYKFAINVLSGMLGKHERRTHRVRVTEDPDQMWTWLYRQNKFRARDENTFVRPVEVGEGEARRTFYIHGYSQRQRLAEVDLPHFIQMKDASNARLYDMTIAMGGGNVLYRKVDCAITDARLDARGATLVDARAATWLDRPLPGPGPAAHDRWAWLAGIEQPKVREEIAKWGSYRPVPTRDVPYRILVQDARRDLPSPIPPVGPWRDMDDVASSDHWERLLPHLLAHRSTMLRGRAGTGKTYVAKNLRNALEARGFRVSTLAFSNTAAIVAEGQTIHSFMRMDLRGKMSRKLLHICKIGVDYVFVDEVSMVPSHLWERLCLLKRLTGATFVLVGDHRQCAPPEEAQDGWTEPDYFDHPAVKWLADYNRATLTVRQRYGQELWDLSERCDPAEIRAKCGTGEHPLAISRLNMTTLFVNDLWMRRLRPADAVDLPANPFDELTQDVAIYPGLPVIGRVRVVDKVAHKEQQKARKAELDRLRREGTPVPPSLPPPPPLLLATGERLVVREVTAPDETQEGRRLVHCVGQRPGGEHVFTTPLDRFHAVLQPAYCVTVERSQGLTIREPYTVYDLEVMDERCRYTAITRATHVGDIHIGDAPRDQTDFMARVRRNIALKVRSVTHDDVRKGRGRPGLTVAHVLRLFQNAATQECPECGRPLKWLRWAKLADDQFSIDRLDDRRGHTPGNIRVTCLACNRAHRNRVDHE